MKKKLLIIIIFICLFIILYLLYYFNYIPHKKYTNNDFNIKTYISKTDKDNDGIKVNIIIQVIQMMVMEYALM